jgi:hypothetical protein
VLSTSSTAFLGLAVLGIVYAANWVRRWVFSSAIGQRGLIWELLIGLGLFAVLLFISIARVDLFDPLITLIQEVVINKPLSDSFYERSQWNSIALQTVGSTWGLGIGFGSTRTSNWFVAIVSNAGIIGAACMAIFLVQTFSRRAVLQSSFCTELLIGLKLSLLPALAMLYVSSAGPDFGLWIAVEFGAIAGIAEFGLGRNFAAERPVPGRFRIRRTMGDRVLNKS